MTVDTPFPGRPATPFWSPYGVWSDGRSGSGMGDASDVVGNVTGDITDVFRTVYSVQPGMYTVQGADGSIITYRQPEGNYANLPVGMISGSLNPSAGEALGSGMWILLGLAALLLFSRGKK